MWFLVPAALSLMAFAWLPTLHPHAAGRVYGAYGGVYVTVALLWLWMVDGVRPDLWDVIGVALTLAGMAIIYSAPRSSVNVTLSNTYASAAAAAAAILPRMRRLLAMILLLLLPLQWSAAAVTSYCQHESDASAQQHIGHHDHEHRDQPLSQSDGERDQTVHFDCALCLAHVAFIDHGVADAALPPQGMSMYVRYSAAVPESPPDNLFRPPVLVLA